MTTQITLRDWETLSAYLDDQLGAPESHELESRLRNNPELSQGLEELRRTRMILRSLPKLRAPRNFTLTPSMAGQRGGASTPSGFYPILRLAATLATLFFLIVTAGGLVLRFNLPAQTVVMRADQSQNAQPVAPFGMGGGGAGPGSNEAPALALPAPTEAAVANATMEKAPELPMAGELQVTPLTPAAPEGTPDESLPGVMPKALSQVQGPAEAQPPAAPAPQALVQQAPANGSQPVGRGAWTFLTVLQILLASLALVSGAAALYLRRLGRR
jgi:hypothetical protein